MSNEKKGTLSKIPAMRGMPQVITAAMCLVVIIVVFNLISEDFLSERNLRILLRQTATILIIGIAQSFVLISGNIDLSIGSIVGMSCMVSATLMTKGASPVTASIITLSCCLIVGIINGQLITRGGLPPFIATLSTMAVARSVAQLVNKNRNTDSIGEVARAFRNLFYYGEQQFFGFRIYNTVLIAIFLWVILNFILSFTKTGSHIYTVADNVGAARLSGINVPITVTIAYVVSSFCACVVGLIICATDGVGKIDSGTMYEMYAIAVCVIGGISALGGRGNLLGTMIGASIWTVLQNGLMLAGTPAPIPIGNITTGVIIVIIVLCDVFVRKSKSIKEKQLADINLNGEK